MNSRVFRTYKVFHLQREASVKAERRQLPAGLELTIWFPSWLKVLPFVGMPQRFLVWWLFDRMGVFRNALYSVAVVRDSRGFVIHRSCVFPSWARTPFIRPEAVEIGDIWTHPRWRQHGLASVVLRELLLLLPASVNEVFYLAEVDNLPSHRLATSCGFSSIGLGVRGRRVSPIVVESRPAEVSNNDYGPVTELAGDLVSAVQIERMVQRYVWAKSYCVGKDVIEVACGTGAGLGLIESVANSIVGSDIDQAILARCRQHYGTRIPLVLSDAQQLPLPDRCVDVVAMFEALYYLPRPELFLLEARRILRPGGRLLISVPNPELFDFHRSPYSHKYFSGTELAKLMSDHGFEVRLFGGDPYSEAGILQRWSRPLKAYAARHNLIPGSMVQKRLLRRLVHGRLVPLTAELTGSEVPHKEVVPLKRAAPGADFRIIYADGVLSR